LAETAVSWQEVSS